jgi:hypothetical protein
LGGQNSLTILARLADYPFPGKVWIRQALNMGDEVKSRFRMFIRQGGIYYWQDRETRQQGSLGARDERAALKLLRAKNEAF